MNKIFNVIKGIGQRAKMTLASAFMFVMLTTQAMAVGTENTAVTGAFTQLKDDLLATMGPIGAVAVGVAALLFAWRYGRKIFATIAK